MTSPVQQLVNLDAAIALVEQTPARMIDLDRWSSNSWWRRGYYPTERQVQRHAFGVQVCLGGLIACDPYFKSLGVLRTDTGAPYMASDMEVSKHLFGASYLFATSCLAPVEEHKEIALRRLRDRRTQVLALMEFEATSAAKRTKRVPTDPVL